jgi:hypothetical protein
VSKQSNVQVRERDPRWVRDALYYADRPSRRLNSDEIEAEIAGLVLAANGGRVVTSPYGAEVY